MKHMFKISNLKGSIKLVEIFKFTSYYLSDNYRLFFELVTILQVK